jgi:hypothetical protein
VSIAAAASLSLLVDNDVQVADRRDELRVRALGVRTAVAREMLAVAAALYSVAFEAAMLDGFDRNGDMIVWIFNYCTSCNT